MKKERDIGSVIFVLMYFVLIATLLAAAIISAYNKSDERKIVEYLASDTEDDGDYIISVLKAKSKCEGIQKAKFYFVEMIDADGDYEHLIVRVDKDGIHEYAVGN